MEQPVRFQFETRRSGVHAGYVVVGVELVEGVSVVGKAVITLQGVDSACQIVDDFSVLGEDATLFFDEADSRAYFGIVTASGSELREGVLTWVVELSPRLWRASRSRRSRVYLKNTVADITRRVLQENGLAEQDFDWLCLGARAPREYTAQYEESDLDFLLRTLEREGIFYFITHHNGRDRVVFADTNNAFESLREGDDIVAFAPHGGGVESPFGVRTWARNARLQPRAVAVRDYDPAARGVVMNPRLAPVMADRWTVDESGLQSCYGDHVATDEEATRIARLRAELLRGEADRFDGVSLVSSMRAGAHFTLWNHQAPGFDQRYAVLSVTHSFSFEMGIGADKKATVPRYQNKIEALPITVPFRPARVTPRPVMPGWLPGVIDGPENDPQSPLDEHGRYLVALPFDTALVPYCARAALCRRRFWPPSPAAPRNPCTYRSHSR
jgi:type VI secretion system secreted protein VgrG